MKALYQARAATTGRTMSEEVRAALRRDVVQAATAGVLDSLEEERAGRLERASS